MNDRDYIPRSELQKLFPIVICLDEALNIVYASERLHDYMPKLADGPRLSDVFNVRRPPGRLDTFDDAVKALDALCLMTARDGKFAVRGQILRTRYENEAVICFCGAPWLYWMARKCPEIKLGLRDFAPSDVQLDQVFLISSQKQMVDDLEKLNSELAEAKRHLEKSNKANNRFFAQMSHEMRTPLNGVVSALALLEANPLDDGQHKLVSLARGSSKNLMEVINYVLDLSKMELAYEEPKVSFVLADLVRSTLEVVAARASEQSLALTVRLAEALPYSVLGSPSRVQQCLLNLIMNAIKFTATGEILVSVDKMARLGSNCTLRFTVTDTGIGISKDDQEQIFDPFWTTGSGVDTRAAQGTGLGLDIFRRNVAYLGGQLGLKSELGKGSSFWFELPVAIDEDLGEKLEPIAADGIQVNLSGHVLLVDDNETNRLLGGMILETMGLKVTSVPGGVAALEVVQTIAPDLVLMDIHMPDIDGIETTRRIRQLKTTDQLPVVALTALAYHGEKEACLNAGMNGYLTKPIEPEVLAAELSQWLGNNTAVVQGSDKKDKTNLVRGVSVLDRAVLQKMTQQIGSQNVQIVLGKVLTEAGQRWGELQVAEQECDNLGLHRLAHSLSGIYRSVGLIPVADRMSDIVSTLRADVALESGWLESLAPLQSDSLSALSVEKASLADAAKQNRLE
ncbi:MAG: signal transduction histidine kinase/CheY-like chemotaxis protein [Halioglobus sp.]|jgi:signal transduction histidine kinase/CheY-like chemotaxis protein